LLDNSVVIVTGATRGIGRAAARAFAREGARVVVTGRDNGRLRVVSDELAAMGRDVLPVRADVRNETDVKGTVDEVMARWGRIDILVNNAAVVTHFRWAPRWSSIRDMQRTFWDGVMDTNLGGTFLCTKYVLPHMQACRSGHIVNLHGGGNVRTVGTCAYAVSKEAIRTFTRYVAEEERPWNVCVVALSPGGIIATEDTPEDMRSHLRGAEAMESWFILAAGAGMELSGQLVHVKDGRLVVRA